MRMLTEVCALRDRGEAQERDVVCTRPGRWGNAWTLRRYGLRALDIYREDLRSSIAAGGFHGRELLAGLRTLAGRRLLCTCPADAPACHVWILAEEVARLTGVPVRPAPGRARA